MKKCIQRSVEKLILLLSMFKKMYVSSEALRLYIQCSSPHVGDGIISRSWLDHFVGDDQRFNRMPHIDPQTFLQ